MFLHCLKPCFTLNMVAATTWFKRNFAVSGVYGIKTPPFHFRNGGVLLYVYYFAAFGTWFAVTFLMISKVAIIRTMARGRTMNTFCTRPAMM